MMATIPSLIVLIVDEATVGLRIRWHTWLPSLYISQGYPNKWFGRTCNHKWIFELRRPIPIPSLQGNNLNARGITQREHLYLGHNVCKLRAIPIIPSSNSIKLHVITSSRPWMPKMWLSTYLESTSPFHSPIDEEFKSLGSAHMLQDLDIQWPLFNFILYAWNLFIMFFVYV